MLRVTELYESSLPKEFVDTLPTTCDACGAPTEITETLSLLRCSNPMCGEKAVQRLVALLQDLDVKNMGEAKCRNFLEHWGITNPYAIFMYELTDGPLFDGCSMDFSEGIFEQIDSKREMLLWEYVKIGNLPGIRDSARKLFADYDDLEEFYDDLEEGGIDFVQDLLGIKKGTKQDSDNFFDDSEAVSVTAVKVYNTLMDHKEELFEALDFVTIKKLTTPVLNVCISTAVGKPYKSKKDFINQMNEQFGHKVHLNFLSSVSKEVHFLIWSKEGAETSKVRKAKAHNVKVEEMIASGVPEDEAPHYIEIMTGAEFRQYLEEF